MENRTFLIKLKTKVGPQRPDKLSLCLGPYQAGYFDISSLFNSLKSMNNASAKSIA